MVACRVSRSLLTATNLHNCRVQPGRRCSHITIIITIVVVVIFCALLGPGEKRMIRVRASLLPRLRLIVGKEVGDPHLHIWGSACKKRNCFTTCKAPSPTQANQPWHAYHFCPRSGEEKVFFLGLCKVRSLYQCKGVPTLHAVQPASVYLSPFDHHHHHPAADIYFEAKCAFSHAAFFHSTYQEKCVSYSIDNERGISQQPQQQPRLH
jgi:hypothetical protein